MSVERSEFEVRVNTPLELAGAEEGAGQLERAIGKAKALGRDFGRLERQLARVREGLRRFRLAHPGHGPRGGEKRDAEECDGRGARSAESRASRSPLKIRFVRRRSARRSPGATLEEGGECAGMDASGAVAENGLTPAPPPESDALPEGQAAGGIAPGTAESPEADWPEAEDAGPPEEISMDAGIPPPPQPLPAGADEGGPPPGDEGMMPEAGQETAAAAEPVTVVWDPRAAQRQVEEMAREALAKLQTAQSRRENCEERRLAAVERQLRQFQERAKINRDGG